MTQLTTTKRIEHMFLTCHRAKRPVLAFSRACSKIGWLARNETTNRFDYNARPLWTAPLHGVHKVRFVTTASAERADLHYLESALNEQKHGLLAQACDRPTEAAKHFNACDRDLASFERAVKRAENRRLGCAIHGKAWYSQEEMYRGLVCSCGCQQRKAKQ